MKEFKGTKGEWKAETAKDWPFTTDICNDDQDWICELRMGEYSTSDKDLEDVIARSDYNREVLANAKLIASAPDLLESLIEVRNILESPGLIDAGDLRRIINSAISKALE